MLGAALVAWVVTFERMRGMDAGPGTDLGGLAWYLGVWVTMMAAMMLPSAAPMVLLFAQVAGSRARAGESFVPTWCFVAGYLAVWTVFGLAAFGLSRAVGSFHPALLGWDEQGPLVAGGAVAAAGAYQLTPLKRTCLRHCRSPLRFVLGRWREGRLGALVMGAEHGAFCVGCCWGLMVVLFALGVMSIVWTAVIAGVVFAEKVLPLTRLPSALAVCLLALGIWLAVAPATVPGLTDPADPMRMERP